MNNVPLTLQWFETDENVDTDTVITKLVRCLLKNDRLLEENDNPLAEFQLFSKETIMA